MMELLHKNNTSNSHLNQSKLLKVNDAKSFLEQKITVKSNRMVLQQSKSNFTSSEILNIHQNYYSPQMSYENNASRFKSNIRFSFKKERVF